MPSNPVFPGVLSQGPKAMGERPILGEEAQTGPPPAAANRAETIFEVTGIALLLLIALAAAWILIRRRL